MTDTDPTHPLVVHCRSDDYDVYIGRGHEGRGMDHHPVGERGWLGNPHYYAETAGTCPQCDENHSLNESIALFWDDYTDRRDADPEFRERTDGLEGETLACWCAPEHHCHGDVIAAIANDDDPDEVLGFDLEDALASGRTAQAGLGEWS